MELRQIRFFVAVAEDLHFGRAAERMYIAQPALSQHIRRLERGLGVQLFDRSARHVRLTPAGEAFLAVARRMLRQVDEGTDAARRADAGHSGSLALGLNRSLAGPVLAVLLGHWNRLRPAVRPRLTSGTAVELVDLVRRRELDLAVVDGPVFDAGLDCTVVTDDRLVVALPLDHPLAQEPAVPLSSLRAERFVTVARRISVPLHDRLIELCSASGFHPEISVEVEDLGLVPVAVTAGLGVGLVALGSLSASAVPGIVWRPLRDSCAAIPLVAVSASEGASTQTREFLLLIENLKRHGRLEPWPPIDLTDRRETVPPLPSAVPA